MTNTTIVTTFGQHLDISMALSSVIDGSDIIASLLRLLNEQLEVDVLLNTFFFSIISLFTYSSISELGGSFSFLQLSITRILGIAGGLCILDALLRIVLFKCGFPSSPRALLVIFPRTELIFGSRKIGFARREHDAPLNPFGIAMRTSPGAVSYLDISR